MQVDRVGASRQLAGVMRGYSVGFFSLARGKIGRELRGRARQGEIASARAARMTNAAEEAAIARIVADVKALEMARGGKGSSTLRPGEKAEQVEPGQMVEVSNHSCLPQQKVEVVAAESAWSLGMPLAVFPFLGNCRDDPALCCYACCFPVCLHAEIAEYNGIEGLCHTKSALAQACCVECTVCSLAAAGVFIPVCPWWCGIPSTRGARTDGRGAFELGSVGASRRIVSIAGASTPPTSPWSATPSSASTGCPTTSSSAGT